MPGPAVSLSRLSSCSGLPLIRATRRIKEPRPDQAPGSHVRGHTLINDNHPEELFLPHIKLISFNQNRILIIMESTTQWALGASSPYLNSNSSQVWDARIVTRGVSPRPRAVIPSQSVSRVTRPDPEEIKSNYFSKALFNYLLTGAWQKLFYRITRQKIFLFMPVIVRRGREGVTSVQCSGGESHGTGVAKYDWNNFHITVTNVC